jgi:hypothetical protein
MYLDFLIQLSVGVRFNVSNDCILFNNCLLLNHSILLDGCLWLNGYLWLNVYLRDIYFLLNIVNLWEGKAELHLWKIQDWILLRSITRNRNRACIDKLLNVDCGMGYLLIQHRNLFTAPDYVPIYGIEVARKTRILVVMQNLLDR